MRITLKAVSDGLSPGTYAGSPGPHLGPVYESATTCLGSERVHLENCGCNFPQAELRLRAAHSGLFVFPFKSG